jgi:hypothetical protein
MRQRDSPSIFLAMNKRFSNRNHGATNFSGKNLNVGIYDNDLKGVGQDARSHLRQFSLMGGLSSA